MIRCQSYGKTAEVAPYAGAWIEIACRAIWPLIARVAPYAGAWIEMRKFGYISLDAIKSLPTRERGLKCVNAANIVRIAASLPTRERGLKYRIADSSHHILSRSLRGSVD